VEEPVLNGPRLVISRQTHLHRLQVGAELHIRGGHSDSAEFRRLSRRGQNRIAKSVRGPSATHLFLSIHGQTCERAVKKRISPPRRVFIYYITEQNVQNFPPKASFCVLEQQQTVPRSTCIFVFNFLVCIVDVKEALLDLDYV
jgi:hypothetical protein